MVSLAHLYAAGSSHSQESALADVQPIRRGSGEVGVPRPQHAQIPDPHLSVCTRRHHVVPVPVDGQRLHRTLHALQGCGR